MELQSLVGFLAVLLFAAFACQSTAAGSGKGQVKQWGTNSTLAASNSKSKPAFAVVNQKLKSTSKKSSAKIATGSVGRSLSGASARGWSSHENSHGHHQVHYYQQHGSNNMDLYSLLAGLSFASLLGATIIYLARRNTSGRRRKRSLFAADVGVDDEDDDGLFVPPAGVENWSWTGPLPSMEPIKLNF